MTAYYLFINLCRKTLHDGSIAFSGAKMLTGYVLHSLPACGCNDDDGYSNPISLLLFKT